MIGLPGETVCIQDGKIYIDGEILEENYGYYLEGKVWKDMIFQNQWKSVRMNTLCWEITGMTALTAEK